MQRWFTREQAAVYTGVSAKTIDRWIAERRLVRHKVDGMRSTRLDVIELDAMMQREEAS